MHEENSASRSQTRPLPGVRPGVPLDPGPPWVEAAAVGYVAAGVPLLGAPSLADSSAEVIDGSTLSFLQHALDVKRKEEEVLLHGLVRNNNDNPATHAHRFCQSSGLLQLPVLRAFTWDVLLLRLRHCAGLPAWSVLLLRLRGWVGLLQLPVHRRSGPGVSSRGCSSSCVTCELFFLF